MVGPSYVTIGGLQKGEGAVITNTVNTTTAVDVMTIGNGYPKSGSEPFCVLQTNYDNWVSPPFFDDRRDPVVDCMNQIGTQGLTKETLYNVLHAHPNRNRLTTYTTLMSASEGLFENSIQYCEEEGCAPW